MSIEIAVICDRCARLIVAAGTARDGRRQNREMGGYSRSPVDYCNDCVAASPSGTRSVESDEEER